MTTFKNFILLSLIFGLTACGGIQRSFVDQMERESDGYVVPGKDFPVMGGDTGEAYRSRDEINARTPASERSSTRSKNAASIRSELAAKEEALQNEEELDQYRKDQRFLRTDSDKLYYLSLQGEDRSLYMKTKREDALDDKSDGQQDLARKHSVHSAAIYLGMPKEEVLQIWGRPLKIDIAGNPKNQNERWSFLEDGNMKQVYFESGKVQGWALDL
jgi:hypothetical protein